MIMNIKIDYKNDKLKELRDKNKLSQSEFSKITGMKLRTLQHYEQGTQNFNGAKLITLLKVCNAFGCKLEDIITDPNILEELKIYKERL